MPNYLPFDPHPRAPSYRLPEGACDCQFHVFGPAEQYPVRSGAAYEMPSATWQVAQAMHRTVGITRGVIVQATTYGADHQVVLDALQALNSASPNSYRGCANALVLKEKGDAYLQRLHDAGVRGARFTRGGLGIRFSPAETQEALAKVKALGWYVKVQPETSGIAEQMQAFVDFDGPIVMDHMGRIDPAKGPQDPTWQAVHRWMEQDNVWVMLSLAEKLSHTSEPWDDVVPLAHSLIAQAPERVIWASDWPHPISVKQPPNEGALLDLLHRFAPEEAVLKKILVDNPARLFGFEKQEVRA